MSYPVDSIKRMFAENDALYGDIVSVMHKFNMEERLSGNVIVGLSGGADSVFLLCFLSEYRQREGKNFDILAVHVNHMIRAEEAKRDEEFCVALANRFGIDILVHSVDVPRLASQLKLGLEEAARNARYSAFDEIMRSRNNCRTICLAHNANDNLETVIFNMMRGSGLSGVCGIPPVRDDIIRPLLHVPKSVIVNKLESYGIPYVTDSTNNSCEYTRNYIRHEIVPKLSLLSTSPESSVSRMTSALIADNEFISAIAREEYRKALSNDVISRGDLLNMDMPIFARVISLFFDEYAGVSITCKHINDILALLSRDNFSYSIGKGYSFESRRGKCRISFDADKKVDSESYELGVGINELSEYSCAILVADGANSFTNVYNFSIHTEIPFDIIDGKLRVRFKRDGDAYSYNGITHKLKKVFNDRNIPPNERNLIPIICDDSGILWVPGLPYRGYLKDKNNNLKTIGITIFYSTDNKGKRIFTAAARD